MAQFELHGFDDLMMQLDRLGRTDEVAPKMLEEAVVRPTGKASGRNIRNMEKLVYLEYGVRGRPATPVLTTAVLNARPDVIRKMQEVFTREMSL